MKEIQIGQEVLVRCRVEAITIEKDGMKYSLKPFSEHGGFGFAFTATDIDIETCRHCGYLGELLCTECVDDMVQDLGGNS